MSAARTLPAERAEVLALCLALLESPLLDRIEAASDAWHPGLRATLAGVAAWARRRTTEGLSVVPSEREFGDAAIVVFGDANSRDPSAQLLLALRHLLDAMHNLSLAVKHDHAGYVPDAVHYLRAAGGQAREACEVAGVAGAVFDATLADAREAARRELGSGSGR